MHFGVFDHLDLGAVPLGEHYENRLKLIEGYDRLGLRTYPWATPPGVLSVKPQLQSENRAGVGWRSLGRQTKTASSQTHRACARGHRH